MKLTIGKKFKTQRAPGIWKEWEIVNKTKKGFFIVRDLSDKKTYVKPFLDGSYCYPIDKL